MIVRIVQKDGKIFECREAAVLDDREADRVVLLWGKVIGGRLYSGFGSGVSKYQIDESSHIAFRWSDIERLELLPEKEEES